MCWGPLKRACHWGPIVALVIIKVVTMCTVACLTRWWPPWETLGGSVIFISFMSSAILTLYFFMQAMFTGPGTLPKGWTPAKDSDRAFLQYCEFCRGYKAPRAHHCRKCGSCNMKMDHHCPWINNCVGHKNHSSFTLFLFFAVVGCFQGAVILGCTIHKAINRNYYIFSEVDRRSIIVMNVWGLILYMFVLGIAIGVVIAVGMLLFFQVRAILRNRTGIEDWILQKAHYRRSTLEPPFIYPYDLGRLKNFVQVLNVWCEPKGDGIVWPVCEGCDQYTLTVEQLSQKAEKRARSREYIVTENFSGWWLPCTKGICVCCHPPCTDESRIALEVGDTVIVTRWKKYWLYGERIPEDPDSNDAPPGAGGVSRHRGWFPRRCGVEVISPNDVPENLHGRDSLLTDDQRKDAICRGREGKRGTSSPSSSSASGSKSSSSIVGGPQRTPTDPKEKAATRPGSYTSRKKNR